MTQPPRGRAVARTLCLLLLAVLAPATVVATWLDALASDTDRYLATVAPLADDPAVQDAVADRVATAVTDRLQLPGLADRAADALAGRGLPERLADDVSALGEPLASSVEGYVRDHVASLVASPEFAGAWEEANREAHTQLVAVLTGDSDGVVQVDDDVVRLDLAVVVEAVRQRLVDDGFALAERLPEVTAEFPLMETADLEKAQGAFGLLEAAAQVLPWLTLAVFAGAVAAAGGRRRRTVAVAGAVLAASMLVLGVVLDVCRALYLDRLSADVPVEAATAVFDQVVLLLRRLLRLVLVVGLVLLVAAWLAGPGPAARWVAARRGLLCGAVLVLAAVAYAAADEPSGSRTLAIAVAVLVALAVIGLAGRSAPADAAARP